MRRSPLSHFFHLLLLTVSLLYLGFVVFISVCERIDATTKCQRTRGDVGEISKTVEAYRKETGALPPSLEAMVQHMGDVRSESWSPGHPGSILDSWGGGYQYRLIPALPAGYGVYSFGMDGVSDSEGNDPDDVNSWTAREKAVHIDPYKPRTAQVAVAALVLGFVLKGLMTERLEDESQP
ncbi:MAG: Type secretion system protein GspG [Akkermansiaceae bacterium]|nr:Type secretion system protein GspG [Akkermansiaceae bacterium]